MLFAHKTCSTPIAEFMPEGMSPSEYERDTKKNAMWSKLWKIRCANGSMTQPESGTSQRCWCPDCGQFVPVGKPALKPVEH